MTFLAGDSRKTVLWLMFRDKKKQVNAELREALKKALPEEKDFLRQDCRSKLTELNEEYEKLCKDNSRNPYCL